MGGDVPPLHFKVLGGGVAGIWLWLLIDVAPNSGVPGCLVASPAEPASCALFLSFDGGHDGHVILLSLLASGMGCGLACFVTVGDTGRRLRACYSSLFAKLLDGMRGLFAQCPNEGSRCGRYADAGWHINIG